MKNQCVHKHATRFGISQPPPKKPWLLGERVPFCSLQPTAPLTIKECDSNHEYYMNSNNDTMYTTYRASSKVLILAIANQNDQHFRIARLNGVIGDHSVLYC